MKKLLLSMKNNFKYNYVYDAFILLVIYSIAIIVVAPLIGTIFAFANIKWGIFAVGLTIITAGIITYYIKKENKFTFNSDKSYFSLYFNCSYSNFAYFAFLVSSCAIKSSLLVVGRSMRAWFIS